MGIPAGWITMFSRPQPLTASCSYLGHLGRQDVIPNILRLLAWTWATRPIEYEGSSNTSAGFLPQWSPAGQIKSRIPMNCSMVIEGTSTSLHFRANEQFTKWLVEPMLYSWGCAMWYVVWVNPSWKLPTLTDREKLQEDYTACRNGSNMMLKGFHAAQLEIYTIWRLLS